MAFHVACPITCRRICFCTLGFPEQLQTERGRNEFFEEVCRIDEFLADPWSLRSGGNSTVQVLVPRISPVDGFGKKFGDLGVGDGGDSEELISTQTKRADMQRKAAAASLAAEDYARRFETGDFAEVSGEAGKAFGGEDQVLSTVKVMCRICFSGENEGSDRALRMLSCQSCSKKYHRNCLKSWAEYRDLYDWSSWVCASCRTCEVCRRAGDPTKFMFCKRCDGAYHSYCQQPPHKNVTPGPYLCPKHTRCHSCGSTVPGSGLSTRWFLGYTCCDACGRLFVKGKYCPVCLKVYRDSESTPMVCCDACQRWVHCQCDGISDEKYQQFQTDRNLYYKCAACRGDCYQVSDLDDAVQELWKRRDEAEQNQIANLRAAAGLPPQDRTFPFSPYSDDDHRSIIFKSQNGKSLKLCVKGSLDKSTKNAKEYGKKLSKKSAKKKGFKNPWNGKTEEPFESFERLHETPSLDNSLGDEKIDDIQSYRTGAPEIFSTSPSNNKEKSSLTQFGITSKNFTREGIVNNDNVPSKVVHIKSSKAETMKGKKLVIHFASRNRNLTNSPRSEASSCHREQDSAASMGSDDNKQQLANPKEKHPSEIQDETVRLDGGKGVRVDNADRIKILKHRGKESGLVKLGKVKSEDTVFTNSKVSRDKIKEECESNAMERVSVLPGKIYTAAGCTTVNEMEPTLKNDQVLLRKHSKGIIDPRVGTTDETFSPSVSDSLSRDSKPLLKLKFKNPYVDNRSSWALQGEDEKNFVKGQRSKRKRPSPVVEREQPREEGNGAPLDRGNLINEMDANWILKKLGKDAIGKRVEVHQAFDDSWHKGVVKGVIEGTSSLTVLLDDGRDKTLELGKQGVRFISQKQKRART